MVVNAQRQPGSREGSSRPASRGAAIVAAVALLLPCLVALVVAGATSAQAQAGPVQEVPGTGYLFGITCPTATTCQTAGGQSLFGLTGPQASGKGDVVTTTDGLAGPAAATPGTDNIELTD